MNNLIYVCTGRIPYDEEDTVMEVEASTMGDAWDIFTRRMLEQGSGRTAGPDRIYLNEIRGPYLRAPE